MKTRNIYISLLLAVLCAAPINARQFEQGEKIYVNVNQNHREGEGKCNWADAGAHLFLHIWKSGQTGQWLTLTKENGDIYSATIPAGNWDGCIIVRLNSSTSTPGWYDDTNIIWNRTGDIDLNNYIDSSNPDNNSIVEDKNCIYTFWNGGGGVDWWHYTPVQTEAISYVSSTNEEAYSICKNALGGPYALHVKLNSTKTDYIYDNVIGFCWFYSTDNKQTWKPIAQNSTYPGNTHDARGDKDITDNNLPSSLPKGTIYYYLYSAKASGRRLIKLTTDATGCDLDCTITAFEVATSDVNAHNNTYTLDGMVAFGEPNGALIIECDGKSTRIEKKDAKSPQIFSIEGLPAATTDGKTTVATARFEGNDACTATVTVKIPNATQLTDAKHIDVLVGQTVTLDPEGAIYTNKHIWFFDGEEKIGAQGAQTINAGDYAHTSTYMYREFNPNAGDMEDMMSNGGYETADASFYGTKGSESTISEYTFWGQYPQTKTTSLDFYNNKEVNPSLKWKKNGFAVVKDANNFAPTYAKVTAREGEYFALFDAASGTEMAGKKAWFANTEKNPNLKLQKGTTYLFSFWAANINNYGEMDNAAKLQFQINGKDLGKPLDLSSPEFRNNRWHQCSATYYADADANSVTISVVNLNSNSLDIGNDFALDDIQFRAVSSVSRAVRMQQVFEVQTHEPAITKFTATPVPMNCDGTEYSVKLHIEYCNQISKIIVKDITDGANRTVWTEDLAPLTNGSDQWDKTQKLDHTVKQTLAAGDPLAKERKYKVYFEKWTKATKTVKFNDPVIPMMQVTYYNKPDSILPCGQKTYSISGTVTYRNMNANAYAWIDKATKVEISGLKQNDSNKLTASFTVPNVPADSAEHKLHVAFEGRGTTCPFEDTFRAAFAPVLDDVQFIGVPAALHCDSDNYAPQVQVRTFNHRNAVLTVEFEGQTPAKESRVVTADITTFDYPAHPVDGGTYSVKVYFDYVHNTFTDCEKSASFTAPIFTKCCTDSLIYHKWNNVLFVNNGDSSIVAYQWYKNGVALDGYTDQYLYTRRDTLAGTSDLYHCVVTRKDGTEEILCEDTFDGFPSSAEASQQVSAASVMVRPTRLPAGNAVTITKTDDETMQATLFTVTGQIISVTCLSNDVSTMLMPDAAGMYLLKIQGTNTQSTVKINVF